MSTTSSATTTTINRLNAEILFWKSETDKRKVQLGEYTLLDDPSDPNDVLWRSWLRAKLLRRGRGLLLVKWMLLLLSLSLFVISRRVW